MMPSKMFSIGKAAASTSSFTEARMSILPVPSSRREKKADWSAMATGCFRKARHDFLAGFTANKSRSAQQYFSLTISVLDIAVIIVKLLRVRRFYRHQPAPSEESSSELSLAVTSQVAPRTGLHCFYVPCGFCDSTYPHGLHNLCNSLISDSCDQIGESRRVGRMSYGLSANIAR